MDPIITFVSVFAIFIPALILPGPDFVAVVRTAMVRGASAGVCCALGVACGLATYASLSLLGLSAVLLQYQWLAWAVRVLGGCYLIYLGLSLLLSRHVETLDADVPHATGSNSIIFGYLVTLTNPKAIVLFTSVFATTVTANTPTWLMAVMIVCVFASALAWYALVALCMASAPVVRRVARSSAYVERFAGVCFVIVGGRIVSDTRHPLTP